VTDINIPVSLGASLDEDGIVLHAWVNTSEDQASVPVDFTTLIDELVEAYSIPNHYGKFLMNVDDLNTLNKVVGSLQSAANYLAQRLNMATIL
jgi:hypothetical protein